jgi:hypothetical protein
MVASQTASRAVHRVAPEVVEGRGEVLAAGVIFLAQNPDDK